jgi:predicted amidophosphoribosyltransferase
VNAIADRQAAISAKNVGITTRTSGAVSPACPACQFPVRRIYAGELICPNCGKREVLCREFWRRIEAAMVIKGVKIGASTYDY